jgi:hypothetical protein
MDAAKKTIDFVETLSYQALPPEVRHQTKRCLLDILGAMVAGYETPVGRLMEEFAGEQAEIRWDAGESAPTDDELERKFFWLAHPVLGKEKTDKLRDAVWSLDTLADLEVFYKLLRQKG